MRANDTVIGAIVALLGLSIILRAFTFPDMPGHDFGPGFFPSLIGAGFIVFSLPLFAKGIREWKTVPFFRVTDWTGGPRKVAAGLWVVGGLIAYIELFSALGFIVVNVLYVMPLMLLLRVRAWKALAYALAGTVAVHLVFTRLLYVPLPAGVFGLFS